MEGKINQFGTLYIRRGPHWKEAWCHYRKVEGYCSDHCALFGEPETFLKFDGEETTHLQLCHVTHRFAKFTDERE